MGREVLEAVVAWQKIANDDAESLEITFHGGEPLVPGSAFYREALPLLRDGLAPLRAKFSIQSNLWLLDDELCELFREHEVSIGTSLDGPREINDRQRGEGYFDRTWAGIRRARAHGLRPGCICTFTASSLPHRDEVLAFFLEHGLDFSLHSALPSLRRAASGEWALSADEHGDLLARMLDSYLPKMDRIKISTLDAMIRGVAAGEGGICTFGDCLGEYLSVAPDGGIYPCQRFAGMPEYRLGDVRDAPTREELGRTPVWRRFEERQEVVKGQCGDCAHFAYCRGGCPYNALADNDGSFSSPRDPDCGAYRRTFDLILEKAMAEVFSPENMEAVVQKPDKSAGLLRRGNILSVMRGAPHPSDAARQARRALVSVALAATRSPSEATERLGGLAGFSRLDPRAAEELYRSLTAPLPSFNNLYLHATFACNLRCAHCYAEAGPGREGAMSVTDLDRACREAALIGFRHAVITGGEPLVHPERDGLLDALANLRRSVKPLLTVLRTNLASGLDRATLERIARSADQVVVSVDGDRDTHDERRGKGSYDATVGNLRRLVEIGGDAELSLAAVLPRSLVRSRPGEAVRALAEELGIRRTRIKPLLPLGRASGIEHDAAAERAWRDLESEEAIARGFAPTASCGMGQNLYVEPDGSAFPCYAWCGAEWGLGSIGGSGGLRRIVESEEFLDLRRHTVDSNRMCGGCAYRYLCGGACRAWSRRGRGSAASPGIAASDLDEEPPDCRARFERARGLFTGALARLGICEAEWREAGLPSPDGVPDRRLVHDN